MSAITDSVGSIHFDWDNQPGITSLLQILALLSGRPQAEVTEEWQGKKRYGEFKTAVADEVARFLTDFHARLDAISDYELVAKLEANESSVAVIANQTLLHVQKAVGLRR